MVDDSHGWSTVKLDRNGIRFFYEEVLGKSMPWLDMVQPPKIQAVPDVLTIDEIARLIGCTRERRFRVFWLATYSMRLRLGQTLKLEIADIDSARMRTLPLVEFLWRLMIHVLPSGYRRMRDFGFLHGNAKTTRALIQVALRVVIPSAPPRAQACFRCPTCQAAMTVIAVLNSRPRLVT